MFAYYVTMLVTSGLSTLFVSSASSASVSPVSFFLRLFLDRKQLFMSTFSDCLYGLRFGYLSKYRMKGLGHRIYRKRSTFLYKLGYSHSIYKSLDLDVIQSPKRHKKKPYIALRGINSTSSGNASYTIQTYRVPNCYCGNGFFVRDFVVDKKEGKKGFML